MLAAEHPDSPRHRQSLARTLDSLAELQNAQGSSDAEGTFRKVLELHDSPCGRFSEQRRIRPRSGEMLNELRKSTGRCWSSERRGDQLHGLVLDLYARMAGGGTAPSRELKQELGSAPNNLANLHRSDAEKSFRGALDILEPLAVDPSSPTSTKEELAIALNNFGEFLSESNRRGDAEKMFTRSVETFDSLLAQTPRAPKTLSLLGYVLENLGRLRLRDGAPKKP